jgi:hypothetical protein
MTGLGAAQPLAACNRAGSGCGRRGPTSGLQLTRPDPAVGCMPPAARFRGAAGGVEPIPDLGSALDWTVQQRSACFLVFVERARTGPPLELPGNAIRWQAEQHVAVVARGPRSDRRQAVLDEECGSGWGHTRSATAEEVWVCDARMEVAVATFRCDVLSWECHRKINVQFGSARPSIARQAHRCLCRLYRQRIGAL